ncbi:mitochondrial carrier domain-containing protein [Annulohypoxylon bovei var. microspora]|nr:mitochondrial carrier domain-containing protein [Annulohypoxylon bovei var. microspora]
MPSTTFANSLADAAAADNFLPALHHAISGSAGTLISTCALYPLSLVVTRLQHQRQQRRRGGAGATGSEGPQDQSTRKEEDGTTTTSQAAAAAREPTYAGIAEAFSKIWNSGGGPKAFYTGLGQDVTRSVLDSFLFFLFYEWIRSSRLSGGRRRGGHDKATGLGVLEELAVGVVAGACSRFFSTPLTNLASEKGRDASFRDIIAAIRKEKGITGLWSGYSASLVLTLNPSITFFLQDFLKRKAAKTDSPGPAVTFLLAAISKAIASTITYPFQIAGSRLQGGVAAAARGGGWADVVRELEARHEAEKAAAAAAAARKGEEGGADEAVSPRTATPTIIENVAPPERNSTDESKIEAQALRAVKNLGRQSIFGTVVRIARAEGVGALYEGLHLELLKVFFGHGATMVAKDVVHRLLFRLYLIAAGVLAELKARRARAAVPRAAAKPAVKVTTTVVEEELVRGLVTPAPAPKAVLPPPPTLAPTPKAVEAPKAPTAVLTPPAPSPPVSSAPSLSESLPPPTIQRALPSPPSRPALPPPPPRSSLPPPAPPSSVRAPSSLPPPPAYSPPPSMYSSPPPAYSPPTRPSASSAPPPAQPRGQLRALRYRLDNEDEWGPRSVPSYASVPASRAVTKRQQPQRRSLSKFDDFVVGVVANMIDKTQREIKH